MGYIRDPLHTGSNPGGKEGLKWEWNIVFCVTYFEKRPNENGVKKVLTFYLPK